MAKDDPRFVTKKLHEIRTTCDSFKAGMALYQKDVIDKFRTQYPIFIKHFSTTNANIAYKE